MALRDYFIGPADEAPLGDAAGPSDAPRPVDASGAAATRAAADAPRPAAAPEPGDARGLTAPPARNPGRFRLRRSGPIGASAPSAVAPSLGVLAAARDLPAMAVAAGLVVGRRAPAVLVCLHARDAELAAPLPAPARATAARLAASLAARGLPGEARGRLAIVRCELADATARALAAASVLPTVLAVAVREPGVDRLLAERDAILVALPPSADPILADVALAGAIELSRSAAGITFAFDPLSRALALGGLRAPQKLREAVDGLLA
jgi:hypothetical protein